MVQPGIYRLKNVLAGKYLDASSKNPGKVHGYPERDNKNQQWKIRKDGNKYTMQNLQTKDYIHVWNTKDRTDVKTADEATPVRFEEHDGAYAIYLEDSKGVIDLDKGKMEDVNVWKFSGAKQQLWKLQRVDESDNEEGPSCSDPPRSQYRGAVPPGTYFIRNVHSGTALDLAGGCSNNGTEVIGYSVGSDSSQQWTFQVATDGYTIKNKQSGTYAGFGHEEYAKEATLLTGNNNPVEWHVNRADKGYYICLANDAEQLVMDLAEGDGKDGAKICLWKQHQPSQDNQKWNIIDVNHC